jgi:hypothetical protein
VETTNIVWRSLVALALAAVVTACGGDSVTNPSGGGSGSGGSGNGSGGNCTVPVGVLGCPKGLVRGTLDNQPFNGGVANGGAIYTPIAANPSLNLPAQDFFVIVAIASNNSQLSITARAKVGQAALGANVIDPETRNVSPNAGGLAFPATSGTGAGWLTSVAGGTGTITVNTVSRTGASGSFSFTMVPTPNTPATGTRQMTGTFDVTF